MAVRHATTVRGPASPRRQSSLRWGAVGLFLAHLLGVGLYLWFPFDRTKDLSPLAITREAGLAVLSAKGYQFSVALTGPDGNKEFPRSMMNGQFQRQPQVLHLKGSSSTGASTVPLQYYVEGQDLYMQDPRDAGWLLLRRADLGVLSTFQPDRLASPLVEGLRSASVLGRERLPGGEALVLKLELDPTVMKDRLGGARPERLQYKLWVYTRSLKPARLVIEHRPEEGAKTAAFRYELSWEFRHRFTRLAVPANVKERARPMPQS